MTIKISRRNFLYLSGLVSIVVLITGKLFFWNKKNKCNMNKEFVKNTDKNIGVASDGKSYVYIARNRTPEENIRKAIDMIGGISEIIKQNDIVILKPNSQWWNHGTTNTNNIKGFIELVLNIPDFKGEIIIADNHSYDPENSRGWTTNERNGDYNLNELVLYFNSNGYENVSKYHWKGGGPNPEPKEGDGGGGQIVNSVTEGDGYIWQYNNFYISPENRKCIMTYPVFTSSFSGIKIDLKEGSLIDGKYVNNVKLINFSCLNHHGYAFGVTASIKNLMGVVDMTCGFHGTEPDGFYNTHFIGTRSFLCRVGTDLKYYGSKLGFGSKFGKKVLRFGHWNTQYTGGALGHWMKTIKMPELNILAAEYAGWGGRGRNGPHKRSNTNCVAISTDAVALDYIGAKNILYSTTPESEPYYRELNDPDKPPFRLFLEECHAQGIGNLDKERIEIIEAA